MYPVVFKSVLYVLFPLWVLPLWPVKVIPDVLISIVAALLTVTFITPLLVPDLDVLYWAIIPTFELLSDPTNAALLAPSLIYISSPLPVAGAVIEGGFTLGADGAVIFGVTGLKFIACGRLGNVALLAFKVIAPFWTFLGVTDVDTSNPIIGSTTGVVDAIP